MFKNLKILIAAGIAVVLLVAGVAIPVLADDTPTPTPPVAITKQAGVLDRAAQILGKTREQLVNAIKQAATELKGKKPTADDYFTKVAEILNVDKNTLVNAVQQAAKEQRDANIQSRLDKAVKNGVLTQDEANQIEDWYSKRPAAIDKLLNGTGLRRLWGRMHQFKFFEKGFNFKNAPVRPNPKISPKPSPTTTTFSTAGTSALVTY